MYHGQASNGCIQGFEGLQLGKRRAGDANTTVENIQLELYLLQHVRTRVHVYVLRSYFIR